MKDFSLNFGPVIAFILPGLVVVWGLSLHSTTIDGWIAQTGSTSAFGGFLAAILLALGIGMVLNGIRSLTLGKILWTPDHINWKALTENESTHKAMVLVVENCWHYHLFYGNLFFGLPFALGLYLWSIQWQFSLRDGIISVLVLLVFEAILFLNAKHNGDDYYRLLEGILNHEETTNGQEKEKGAKES